MFWTAIGVLAIVAAFLYFAVRSGRSGPMGGASRPGGGSSRQDNDTPTRPRDRPVE